MKHHKLSRRAFLQLSATTTALWVSACVAPSPQGQQAGQAEGQPAGGEKVRIQWWHGWGGMTGIAAMQGVADAFNQQSDTIEVERLQVEDIQQKYMSAIAGGEPPDVEIGNLSYEDFWARGVLHPLDELIAASQVIDLADFLPAGVETSKWQGTTYGLPCIESSVRFGFSYNVELVEAAGLDPDNPPLTWDEVFAWHEATTRFDSAGNLEQLGFDPMDAMGGSGAGITDPLFWPPSFGLKWFDQSDNTFHFDDERFVAALATIRQFYDYAGVEKMTGYRSSYGTWTQSPTASFPAGVQAMIVNGPWQPGELAHSAPERTFRYTWSPTPTERRGTKVQASGSHYGNIPVGTQHLDEAFAFLEFCTKNEVQDIVFAATGWLGPRISWNQQVDVSTYQGLDFYINSITEADEMWANPVVPIADFVYESWIDAADAVNFGQKTPAQAAQDMQTRVTEELHKQFPELG
jgi:multiple sugar transport system substrate-binding protein